MIRSGENYVIAAIIAVEPEPYPRERAQRAAAHLPVLISVVDGGGYRLL